GEMAAGIVEVEGAGGDAGRLGGAEDVRVHALAGGEADRRGGADGEQELVAEVDRHRGVERAAHALVVGGDGDAEVVERYDVGAHRHVERPGAQIHRGRVDVAGDGVGHGERRGADADFTGVPVGGSVSRREVVA